MIKLLALIYKLTGWYPWLAELYEYRNINWDSVEKTYKHYGDITIEDAVGIEIGTWQAHTGFYRRGSETRKRS